jgi:Protein of unknown function (DUF2695)
MKSAEQGTTAMSFVLDAAHVAQLCEFVDQRVRKEGCDHSHRFTRQWAMAEAVDWDDLLDILDANGAYCDCEVVLNLPEDEDLECEPNKAKKNVGNPWLLPPGFSYDESALFQKRIVGRKGIGKNTHALDGELLVPAPRGAKPKGRVRRIVHFFVGCQSGKASEVGVVEACDAVSAADFALQITAGGIDDTASFGPLEAAFVLSKIAALGAGTTVGTAFLERVGIASKHEELTIHRVILRG